MSKRKLLLADDSITIQKVVNLTFADEGIDVVTAGDGDNALRLIAEERPDIILADVHMPGPDGYRICHSIRSNPETRDIPVVLLVGSFEPFDEGEAERVGASAFMTKPFQSIRQLVEQVSELLENANVDSVSAEETASEFVESESVEPFIEPEPSPAPVSEIGDIEHLYNVSMGETVEMPVPEPEVPTYIDAGMDDEMIETSYVNSPLPDQEPVNYRDSAEHITESFEYRDDQPPAAEFEPEALPAESVETAPLYETPEEVDVEEEVIAAEDEAPHYFEPAQPPAQHTAEIEPDFEFDEINLLEIPAPGSERTIEFTTPEAALEAGSRQQAVSISPELLEIIVQRVVEKLSEKY